MREFDAFLDLPSAIRKADKTIHNRIAASYRDREFYDGKRKNGYGGFKDDGRWGPIAERLIKVYSLTEDSNFLQINCHKGFLVKELLERGIHARGTEVSQYAIDQADFKARPFIRQAEFTKQPFRDREFDLVLGASPVYAGSLGDAITVLREIERVGKGKSFVTLAAYEEEADYWLLRKYFTLGSLILKKDEWIEVLNHCGYRGDYRFDTAKTLNLQ